MNEHSPTLIPLPAELSDEAAAQILELLYELAAALESAYAGQLRRYYRTGQNRPEPPELDRDPPF